MDTVRFTVEGITPLLMNNPAKMGMETVGTTRGNKVYDPAEEAEAAAYRNEDGNLALPGVQFRSSVVNASTIFKAQKGRGSLKGAIAHIQVDEELVPLKTLNGKWIKEYEIDTRRAVVQRQGILRWRPRIFPYRASFTVLYDTALIKDEIIKEVLSDAGNRIGVGDYRPQKGGWFGRFQVIDK